jgi:predicted MFS family arabinose efflux permease
VIPVYLQTILGYDALQTGIKLIPLSIGLVACSAIGSRLSSSQPVRRIARLGQALMAVGALVLLAAVGTELKSGWFFLGMLIMGAGFGLLASQLGNANMSAVEKSDTSEVGGLQGTFQNLGSSFGTALVGSVFMLTLTSGFTQAVQNSSNLSASAKSAIIDQSQDGVQIVSQSQVSDYVTSHGGSKQTAGTVAGLYESAQLDSLREALFLVFAVALLSLVLARHLPEKV